MQVGTTQSQDQSLIASVSVTKAHFEKQVTAPQGTFTASGDLLEIGIEINGDFANRILQDSLEKRLNEAFETAGLDMSVESLLASGQDLSPEAVSGRIVDFAVSLFDAFKGNNADQGASEQLEVFVAMIKGAVEQGFAEAGDILKGIGQITSAAQDDIDETFDLTMEKIDAFAAGGRTLIEEAMEQQQQVEEGEGEEQVSVL